MRLHYFTPLLRRWPLLGLAALISLIVLTGPPVAEADGGHDGGTGHVHLFGGYTPPICGTETCPDRPEGYAVPGPDEGEITIHWTSATPSNFHRWRVYQSKSSTTTFAEFRSAFATGSKRSHTFSNLDAGSTYTVGLAAQAGSPVNISQHAIARLMPLSIPTVSSASVDGNSLTITFSENLGAAANLANTAFAVKKTPSGGSETVVALSATAPSISGKTVTLTLANALVPTDTGVKVSYTVPTTGTNNKLKSATGGLAAAFTDQAVTNNTQPPPVVSSASVNVTSLTITFDRNLAAAPNLANSAFTVKKTPSGGSETSVSLTGTPSISGKTVTLTLASAVMHSDTGVKVSYTLPTSGTNNRIESTVGGVVASFTDKPVNNDTPPPPVVSSAAVRGTSLTIRFNERLAAAANLTNSAFTVKVNGSSVTLSGTPSIGGIAVTLTLTSALEQGDTVMVRYTKPTSGTNNKLKGTTGSEVASFTDDLMVYNDQRPPIGPGYSIHCSDYGYWYVSGDIRGNPGARSGIACDMAKPGWIFEWNRPGYIKWVYRGDRVVTPYTNPGSDVIRTRLAPIQGGNARPPVNQPVADGTHYDAFTYNADANNRAVRGADGQCYRERRVSGRWQRSTAYRTDPNNYLEACHWASWNAHNRWRNLPLVYPASITLFPSGPAPVPPVFESAAVDETTLTMTFNENLDRGSVPSPGTFRVTVNNARRNVAAGGVAISGKTVRLTLASAVAEDDTVKVRYSRPSSNPLKSASYGKSVDTFTDQAVTTPETIWSATLTVKESPVFADEWGCTDRSHGLIPCNAQLDYMDTFSSGGTNYRIIAVYRIAKESNDRLIFRLDKAIPSGLTLHVGDRQLPVADATLSDSDKNATWTNPGFTWMNNQQVSLRLTALPGSSGDAAVASEPVVVSEGPQPTSVEGVTVTSGAGADKTYGLGEIIRVQVTFVGPVEVDTTDGTPRLKIDMDPADWGEKWAAYASGSGTNSLTFTHTVVEPNYSTQGIAVLENSLELNGGTISFSSGHAAFLSHTGLAHDANHKVDWQTEPEPGGGPTGTSDPGGASGDSGSEQEESAPVSVSGAAVASSPALGDTYGNGETISIILTFSDAVDVTGSPRLKLDLDSADWGEQWAAYASGSGTATLTFTYIVVEPNISTQGIAVLVNTLELNGGTIQADGVDANLAHTGLAHDDEHKVDWRLPAAAVTGVEITSDPGDDDTYARDDVTTITVTFSKTVDVTGTPRLKIDMDPAEWGEKWAAYQGGSGTTTLTFTHTVVEPNISTQGIAVLENSLELNGGTMQSDSLAALLAHTGLAHDAQHKVDWQLSEESDTSGDEGGASGQGGDQSQESSPASVSDVAVSSSPQADATYGLGEIIGITLTFSEAVDVTGTPRLKIDMDPAEWGEKWAAYQSGSGTATLTFSHTVVEPNISTQGIAVLANSLELNGGTIQADSVDASLAHTGLAHDANHKVDWRLPAASVTGVEITSDPGDDDTYASDDVTTITVTFSKTVDVTGTPRLKIDMDPAEWGEKWAAYQGGSGTTTLTFTHTVVEPNISTQGIAVLENSLELNGGTMQSDSLAALLAHTGLAHDANHKVDWQD